MGNIYSEVGRSLNAKSRNDLEASTSAMYRAVDLFDSTAESLIDQKLKKFLGPKNST